MEPSKFNEQAFNQHELIHVNSDMQNSNPTVSNEQHKDRSLGES